MVERTTDGRAFRVLNIIDDFTRECLSGKVNRKISSQDIIEELFNLFIFWVIPEHIRSDNDPEFTAKAVRRWLNRLVVKMRFDKNSRQIYDNFWDWLRSEENTWTI